MSNRLKPIPPTPREMSNSLTGEPYITGSKNISEDPNSNRALQTSMEDTNWKDISVGLEDIDESIKYYFEKVIRPTVVQNGQVISVPIIYGSPERWKSVQADGYYRDKEGKILTPIIMFKREVVGKNRNLGNKLDGNQAHLMQIFKSTYNKHNTYDAFSQLVGRKPSNQYYMSIVPDYVTITYSCVLFTEYVEQMNKLIEAINFASDSYWGDPTKFQFRAKIDDYTNITELNNGSERTVKTNFSIILNGYIIPDSVNKELATQKIIYSPAKIIITNEVVMNNYGVVDIIPPSPPPVLVDLVVSLNGNHDSFLTIDNNGDLLLWPSILPPINNPLMIDNSNFLLINGNGDYLSIL